MAVNEIVYRFLIGGAVVSAFSLIGELFKPKSFAGLFGAAPSVALATLALTITREGSGYAADEARSMIAGAVAFVACAFLMARLFLRWKSRPLTAVVISTAVWFAAAFGMWFGFVR